MLDLLRHAELHQGLEQVVAPMESQGLLLVALARCGMRICRVLPER